MWVQANGSSRKAHPLTKQGEYVAVVFERTHLCPTNLLRHLPAMRTRTTRPESVISGMPC